MGENNQSSEAKTDLVERIIGKLEGESLGDKTPPESTPTPQDSDSTNGSNPEKSTPPPSLDPINQPSETTKVLKEENPVVPMPAFVQRIVEERKKEENSSQPTGLTPKEKEDKLVDDTLNRISQNQAEARKTQEDQLVDLTATEKQETANEDILEEVEKQISDVDAAGKVEQNPVSTINNVIPPIGQPVATTMSAETNATTDAQAELLKANTELINAIKELTKAIKELREAFPNDTQIKIIANNIILGTGKIINSGSQNNLGSSDNVVNNAGGVGEEVTVTPTETEDTNPVVEETSEEKDEEKISKVNELQKLNKEKKELEEKSKDPNLSQEERERIEASLEELKEVIEKTEAVITIEQNDKAEKVIKLTEEEKKEFSDAGKTKEGFMATITRMFTGKKWKAFLANAGISTASTLAVSKIAAVTIATFGPVGIGVIGGLLVGLGGIAAFKTIRNVKETADSQGVSVIELLSEKRFILGALLGGVVSGSTRVGLPTFIPGVGPILPLLGLVTELGVSAIGERNLNKKQEELVKLYLSNFESRRYKKLKDQGYLAREGVNLEKIVADMTDANINPHEQKTAKKAAIASLLYLYNETKDEKYKILHYTVKEDGKDVIKELDIRTLEVRDTEDNTKEYPKLQLMGNFESFVDTLVLDELKNLTLDASANISLEEKRTLTNKFVSLFVGIEATDVDILLSKEREQYLESVAFLTGFRTGSGVVNSLIIMGSGATLVGQAVEAHNQISSDSSVEQQYRESLGDEDANVDSYTREDGTKVNTIDLDGDGTPDLVHDTSSNEYSASTLSGAEKLFEIQNPKIGDVNTSQFETSSTGITGTFVAENGEVVGVMYNDVNGNIGVMNSTQLGQTLQATYGNGTPATFNISSLQSNGEMLLNIGDQQYSTNLSTLEGIGGTDAILGVDSLAGSVAPGDSVPSVLTKIMQQAKVSNPNLAQYDDYELQRSLYQGNRLANDSAIRSEFGFTNPVQPGQEFNVRNSPTILGWLEGLNGGPVTLPEAGGSIAGSDGISFAFNGPQVNTISLDGLTPFEVDVPIETDINSTHLATLVAAGIGAFAPRQIGGITRTTTIELFGGDVEDPDPTPVPPTPTPPKPEQEKEYIFNVLKTQVFTYVRSEKGKTKVGAANFFNLGDKELRATETGWFLDGDFIENKDISTIVETFLSIGSKDEQAKVLVQVLDKIMPTKRVELGNAKNFYKLSNGTWREFTEIKGQEEKEIIDSEELADRILLIQRNEDKNIIGTRALPGVQEVKTESSKTDTKTTSQTSTTVKTANTSQNTTQADKKNATVTTPGIIAQTKVETVSAERENNTVEISKEKKFEIAMNKIIISLRDKKLPITISGVDYAYNTNSGYWSSRDLINDGKKKHILKDNVITELNSAYASEKEDIRENLARDVEAMLSRFTKDGLITGEKNDKIIIGDTKYLRIEDTLWRADDKKNSENRGILTDKQFAERIVNIERTEQQDSTTEVKEVEKPEKKGRKLLRAALLATGIGGGVIVSSLTGMPGMVALSAAIISTGALVFESVAKGREKSFEKKYKDIDESVKKREDKTYTEEDLAEQAKLKKKRESASNTVEICKDIAWLTNPMAITSLAYGFLSPKILDAGLQIDIKAWLEGTMNKIKSIDINIDTAREPFKFGK